MQDRDPPVPAVYAPHDIPGAGVGGRSLVEQMRLQEEYDLRNALKESEQVNQVIEA